jgi:cellulose synthase/poly-beta-1,6-N-acetylglucosamine synthase-like glycosyltransferase
MLDADFRAPPDWLRRAVGVLEASPKAAFVQFRFEFSNRGANWLTRGQQLSVDGHFLAEQAGRAAGREPFQFNGTGGVWRRAAIEAAGGWSPDTLAEDLDLAIRAFAAGFEARLVLDPPLACEAPATLTDWRRQQERWSSGFVQVALKTAPLVWGASWSPLARVSTLLLLGLQLALPCFLVALLAFAGDIAVRGLGAMHIVLGAAALLCAGAALAAITAPPFRRLRRGPPTAYVKALFALPSLLIYMALMNSAAVLAAPFRKHRVFVRTPKSGRG